MSQTFTTSPISLEIDVSKGLTRVIDGHLLADEQQQRQLQEVLELQHVHAFQVCYRVAAVGADRYRVAGTVQAKITQRCVVSFEPLEETVNVDFDASFWPQEQVQERLASNGEDMDGLRDEPEPYSAGRLDLGQFFYEILATAIEPYPRKPGVELQLPKAEEQAAAASPFAALKDLRK